MTIDERLERLSERDEALTQSVELMRMEGQEQGKRIAEQGRNIDKIVTLMESFTAFAKAMREDWRIWKAEAAPRLVPEGLTRPPRRRFRSQPIIVK